MAEDRFANVFTAETVMSAANTVTFTQLQFGITLRDRTAIVIDQLYIYASVGILALLTTANDELRFAITTSDSMTDIGVGSMDDRRILYSEHLMRLDLGTAGTGVFVNMPIKSEFSPPLIVLPTRIFFAMGSVGLAAAGSAVLRMHYRTVNITQDQQLIEVLESFALSS